MSLKSIFGGGPAASADATPAPNETEEAAPAPPQPVPDKRAEIKARWRLGVSCSDKEFQSKVDEFTAMFKGRHPLPLDEVLDEHFTEHEKAMFTRAPKDSELERLQRGYSRKYHRLLRSARFCGAKVATPGEARATKLAMLYFGLPVSPWDSMEVDREPPSDSEDEYVGEREPSGALRWLNAYTKRTYGMPVDRNALDPKCEEYYAPMGTNSCRVKGDGWFWHFKKDMASLRGGGSYQVASDSEDEPVQPTGPFWRLHGRRGQVVFHDLDSFRLAVDRLLGLRQRGGFEVLLIVRDDTKLRSTPDYQKFTTETEDEDGIFVDYIKRLDPGANRRTYYLTLPDMDYPKPPQWIPDKNDRNIVRVRREGDVSGEVAYLNIVPFANRHFALNPELGSEQFTSYLCDVAKLLIPGTTSGGQSVVHRTVQVRAGNFTANSVGGLNLTADILGLLHQHATGAADAELTISCPEPQKDGRRNWRIYIPGVCVPDQSLASFAFNPRKARGRLADTLRRLLGSVMGADYDKISHVEIFCPGERMLRTLDRDEPGPFDFDIGRQDAGVDETLETSVSFTGLMEEKRPQNRAFMGVRPVFEEYTAIMRGRGGTFSERGRPSFKFATPSKRWSGCTLEEFRELVLDNSLCPEDTNPNNSDIYISQVQPGVVQEPDSENCVAGSRNPILIRHDMDEGNWAVITRLIVSRTLYVQRATPATEGDLEDQEAAPYGFSNRMWNSGTQRDGLFPPIQPIGRGLVGPARSDNGTKAQGATRKAAWAAEAEMLKDQPEPAFLRRPPTYSTKYPLSQAERDAAARKAYFPGPISVYEQSGPRLPQPGPPVEQFLNTGPSVPSISRSMMTATEQRQLSNAFVKMRNIAVGREYACPFRGCEETFRVGDTDAIHAHAERCHAVEKCNFCDERLYRHWDAEQRHRHFALKHADLFTKGWYGDVDRTAGLGLVFDQGYCADRERAYNFCPRCGRDHRVLGRHADRVRHDNTCNYMMDYPEDRPFCFCDDCTASTTTPHPARSCCGREARRTFDFCEGCGDANPDGGCPHPASKCTAKDSRHVGRAPYCSKCGLALAPYSKGYRDTHALSCRGFNGTPDAFCPWCGVAASHSRRDWLAHLGGCAKNTGGHEGPVDLASGRPWDALLVHVDRRAYDSCYLAGKPKSPWCWTCGADIIPHTGQGHWDHFATEHPGKGLEDCPYCDEVVPFASLGWGNDERGTAKKIAHLQHHIEWARDVFDEIKIYGEGHHAYLGGMDDLIDRKYGTSGKADTSDQPETRPFHRSKSSQPRGRGISPADVNMRSPAKAARGGRGGARGGRAAAAATGRATAPPAKAKAKAKAKSKPAVTVVNYGSEDEELFGTSSEEDDGPHPEFPDDDGDYGMSEPGEKAAAARRHGPADPSYKPRKPSDWDDPELIKEAVFDPPVEGSPGLPAVAAGDWTAGPVDDKAPPPASPTVKRKRAPAAAAAAAAGDPPAAAKATPAAKKRKAAEAAPGKTPAAKKVTTTTAKKAAAKKTVATPAAKKAAATPAAKKVAATPAPEKEAATPATKKAEPTPVTVVKAATRKLMAGTAPQPPALGVPAAQRTTRSTSRALSEAASSDAQ
ncbi:hypothetical protein GGTG_09821 [Gaeumannomyces tritici R3-111a-1]|uniref:Uncharacterized protein n=1 Tax=Gaeumannomyces tritici (strain R3-111a-1) TaxID=644352 RepID=J3P8I7_GAET3|nr:hypothetical protein GGTG_09821 [Gaeumannomyces tritici R3-111a-1]EJT72970.1 hypothetical protein GGTG_09821 [Gaeumannomyces tritici R3-111a-1]